LLRRTGLIRRQLVYRDWPNRPPIKKGIDVAVAIDLMRVVLRRQYDPLVLFSSDTDLLPALAGSPAAPDARRSGLLARRQQHCFPGQIAREDAADLGKAQDQLQAAEAGPGPPAPGCSS
jgi:NYN domain